MLLRDLRDPALVADDLVRRWNLNLLSQDEQEDCAQFLVASGLFPVFFQQILRMIQANSQLPWAQFAEALGRGKIRPTSEEIDAMFEGAEEQRATSDLVRSYQLDIFDRRFTENRKRIDQLREEELERRKQDLKDQLKFLQANRLDNEESLVLEQIEALFPQDPEFQIAREALKVRRAREALARLAPLQEEAEILSLQFAADRLSPEQQKVKDMIVLRAKEMAKKDPALAYDLAMSLHFMDFNAEAYEVLKDSGAGSAAIDWLKLELLIHARQFVTALDESAHLESKYSSEPEAAFAVTYARARALKGLGQAEMAVDLLRSLVRVRPSYKSAQSLLLDWSGDDE